MRISWSHSITIVGFCSLTFIATYLAFRPAGVGPELPPAGSTHVLPATKIAHEATPVLQASSEKCRVLEMELKNLQAELSRLRVEMAELEKAAIQGIVTSMIERLAEKNAAVVDAQEATANTARRASIRSDEWFGGMYDWLLLLHDASRLGDAGVEGLIEFAQDPNKRSDDRDLALETLSFLPTKASLDFIMQPHPDLDYDGFTDLSDGSVLPHLERLPTGDIAEYIPEIREHIAASLESGSSSRYDIGSLVALALTHQDAESRRMLDQLTGNDAQVTEAITSASWLGTQEALRYVEEIARTHPSESVRSRAQELLDAE